MADATKGFRLGSSTKSVKAARPAEEEKATTVNRELLNIDYLKNIDTSDYLQEGDVGFKKPKKKKKQTNKRIVESDLAPVANGKHEDVEMDVDGDGSAPSRTADANFVDDDELQAALARSRKAKMRKVPKLSPEEIAKRIAEEREAEAAEAQNGIKEEEGEMTIDDTTEFIRTLEMETEENRQARPQKRVVVITNTQREEAHDDDSDEDMEELEAGEVDPKQEEAMRALHMELDRQFGEMSEVKVEEAEIEVGTAAEKTHLAGMAGTLSILRAQGALQETSADQRERERVQRERDIWLAEQRTAVALRELERAKARGSDMGQQQREYENRLREQKEIRQSIKSFENYKPDVSIVYHDEFGREMTPKEAWKALSHRFHGKGSGKTKTEKRLKRIAEEKKMQAMVSGETPLGMTSAFQARQEKLGQAHMVLSVGNRGAAPQLGQYIESPNLTKQTKTEKKKKAKEGGERTTLEQAAMID
ncbi:hypothetical protein FRC17_008187, partial [Serendipita sp. 399]